MHKAEEKRSLLQHLVRPRVTMDISNHGEYELEDTLGRKEENRLID